MVIGTCPKLVGNQTRLSTRALVPLQVSLYLRLCMLIRSVESAGIFPALSCAAGFRVWMPQKTGCDNTVTQFVCLLLQKLSGPGLNADINLPQLKTLYAYDKFELDFQLSCPGDRDKDCPIWDHTVQLFVCCHDPSGHAPPCESCDPTVWSEPYSASSSQHGANWTGAPRAWPQPPSSSSAAAAAAARPRCGRELGRWITPFRLGCHALHAVLCTLDFDLVCICSVLLCFVPLWQQVAAVTNCTSTSMWKLKQAKAVMAGE